MAGRRVGRLARRLAGEHRRGNGHYDEKELEAALALARGDDAAAEALLVEATVLEGRLNAPSGPPFPMKSAYEMYGEFLLARGRPDEAAVQFARALERMPNRTRSVRGLESARAGS